MSRPFPRHTFDAKPDTVRMNVGITDAKLANAFGSETLQAITLEGILNRSITVLPMRSFLDPEAPAILDDLQRIACAAAGAFGANGVPAGTEITTPAPNRQSRRVVSDGPRPAFAHAVNWQYGFYAALAAPEREATEVLSQVPAEALRKGQAKAPEWLYLTLEALQAFVRKRSDAGEKLTAAMKATDPETCAPQDKTWVLDVAWPVLELAWTIWNRDAAAYDEAMWKALQGHEHYYAKAEGKRDILGMIALRPLAMAVWAKDLGLVTTVVSDYIPRWIIDR